MKITLSNPEQRICTWLAKNRYANNRNHSVVDRKIGPQGTEETDLEGIAGEIAFCKLLNCYPDLSVSVRSGGYEVLVDGHRVDVKTTKYITGKLLAVVTKSPADTDIYVLMIGTFPAYEYVGWAWADELINKDTIIDLGYGPTHALIQSQLRRDTCLGQSVTQMGIPF